MMESQETCPLCSHKIEDDGERVLIGAKEAEGINKASIERGVSTVVAAGAVVHKRCHMNYINKKQIDLHKKATSVHSSPAKRGTRVSTGSYDSTTQCLFCGQEVVKTRSSSDFDDYSFVKMDGFVRSILSHCKQRIDDWAITIQGRIAYFGKDLHAADCLYHRSCDISFRTNYGIPMRHGGGSTTKKPRKVGRLMNMDQEQAFLRMCAFLEDNDEEQLTVTDLAKKMTEYLLEGDSAAYSNRWLRYRLEERYGDSLFIAECEGLPNIVTFREKTRIILRDYFRSQETDEEAQKRAIIETAAKLIKSDIKSMIPSSTDEYPKTSSLECQSALDCLPLSLLCLLETLFVGKDIHRKVASIGQSVVQTVRPRAVVAPLQLGLAVQLHHHFRSRFLVDSLSAMGYCSSYSEVQRFEENAAASVGQDVLGGTIDRLDTALLFAADNVDHNIITLDGKGTFHGMGMVATVTPGRKVSRTVLRRKTADLEIVEQSRVDVREYRFAKHTRRNIKFKVLCDHPGFADLLQELEQLYAWTLTGESDLNSVITSTCLSEIVHLLSTKRNGLSTHSHTSKLWLNYQQMVGVARELIEADRTGSWLMHLHAVAECLPIIAAAGHGNYVKAAYLYLQSMTTLEDDMPSAFHRFINGLHVVRRTDQYWAGLGCDLVIEQALMRSLKTAGGLTRGSGMSEHQRALWTLSVPVSSSYGDAMQGFTRQSFVTSEQHKEARTSRTRRDLEDLEKIADKLETFSPFSDEVSLRNIITGVNTNKDANVHNLFTIVK
ncbi:uncharacterized protein [Dendrobates tinctorius]